MSLGWWVVWMAGGGFGDEDDDMVGLRCVMRY
jgi:hypothetical protein